MTDQQIVKSCNALAAKIYESMGYTSPKGYRFDQAKHPQECGCWSMAVMAYEHIGDIDVEEALERLFEQ